MEAELRGISGPGKVTQALIGEGQRLTIGRTDRADVCIPNDSFLSGMHFELECREGKVTLHDLGSSNGTTVNRIRTAERVLHHGDSIEAGETIFELRIASEPRIGRSVIDVLSSQPEPLFAVLDTAREPKIYDLLALGGEQYCSLYQGRIAAELEHVAPYLVLFRPDGKLLERVLQEGWAKSWGIFLTCSQPIDEVRRQLRKSVLVTLQENQENVFFRFYDPRVLRVFLPATDPRQLAEFGGPISSFLMEGDSPEILLRIYPKDGSVKVDRIRLT